MTEPVVMLVDNGSTRAASTLSLRGIAARLSDVSGEKVHPVSLKHADRIGVEQLGGQPAAVFARFVRQHIEAGQHEFLIVPLFFGKSRALTSFIPEQIEALSQVHGQMRVRLADVLVPLPAGEGRLGDILAAHALQCGESLGKHPDRVVVVDHGSPIPQVTAVREFAVGALHERLPEDMPIDQAVMERREGPEYDFNGELLEDLLDRIGEQQPHPHIALAMMFLSPGRHAGAGGDIAEICAAAMARRPGLKVAISPLIGEHPLLIDILHDRLRATLAG